MAEPPLKKGLARIQMVKVDAVTFRKFFSARDNGLDFDFYQYAADAKPVPAHRVRKGADGRIHFHSDPGLGLQPPRQPHFGGRVFAFMNGGSFSTACEFFSMLPLHKRGVLKGEEAAGGQLHAGSTTPASAS